MSETKEKKAPTLPKDVSEKFDCVIVPCVVHIQNPKDLAGRYDLTQINMATAERLAKAKKYLVAKTPVAADKK